MLQTLGNLTANALAASIVAAIIGGIVVLYLHWRDGNRQREEALAVARIVYIEIGGNLVAARRTADWQSAHHLAADAAWRSHSAQMASILSEDAQVKIATAYMTATRASQALADDPLELVGARTRGEAAALLEGVARGFAAAEAALRPIVWTKGLPESLATVLVDEAPHRRHHPLRRFADSLLLSITIREVLKASAYMLLTIELWAIARALRIMAGLKEKPKN